MSSVISIENVSKSYRLGLIGSGTLREDLQSWWHRVRGLPDPNAQVGQMHHAVEGHTLWALQDVSLEIRAGEVWGIIGRNGAGKSTLLKILSRVTAPTSGRIRVKGRIASLLEVGTGFHPELTGRENVFLNGAILGMTKAEVAKKFDEIVAFSEIEQFIDTPVKRYSSGMYVRLAFAVAAHLEPEILIVDEVLAVGDMAFQSKCLGKMNDVAAHGRTVLFVSHNMTAIRTLCPQTIVISHGRVASLGESSAQIAKYFEGIGEGLAIRHEKRAVTKDIQITRVEVMNRTAGNSWLVSGDDVRIEVDYVCRDNNAVLAFTLIFRTLGGDRVLHMDTTQQDVKIQSRAGDGTLVCDIPRFPLGVGKYYLSAGVNNDHRRVDDFEPLVVVEVSSANFYRNGRPAPLWGANVYTDCRWSQHAQSQHEISVGKVMHDISPQ